MLSKIFAIAAIAITGFAIHAAFTQRSAMVLRQENPAYWERYGTRSAGVYRSGAWQPSPVRSSYGGFRGGGPGAGK